MSFQSVVSLLLQKTCQGYRGMYECLHFLLVPRHEKKKGEWKYKAPSDSKLSFFSGREFAVVRIKHLPVLWCSEKTAKTEKVEIVQGSKCMET